MLAIQILSRPEIQRLSLTLLHFVWQGVVVAVMTAAVVFALRLRHGRARYAAYLLGFLAMFMCPIFTYLTLRQPSVASMSSAEDSAHVMHTPSPEATELQPVRLKSFNEAHLPVAQATERERWRERGREWLSAALPWVPAAWAVGVMLLGARLLTGAAGVRRWKRGASDLPAPLLARVDQLGTRIGLPGFRRVFASPHVGQPSAVGFWKPVVILPLALVAQMPPDMLDAVIAHELAHLRRLDPFVNLAQRLVETLLFYHPAVWWLSGMIRREREICCDELAAAITGRMTYVSALEHVARFTLGLSPATYVQGLALTFGGRRSQVLHRMKHLLGMPMPARAAWWPAGAVALIALLSLGISLRLAHSAPPAHSAGAATRPTTGSAAATDASFAGRVLDNTGTPARDAVITAYVARGRDGWLRVGSAKADAEGRFQGRADQAPTDLVVESERGAITGVRIATAKTPLEIRLREAAELRVAFLGPAGEPVADLGVTASEGAFGGAAMGPAQAKRVWKTDAHGLSRIDRLPLGSRVSLRVNDERFAQLTLPMGTFALTQPVTRAKPIVLSPASSISGRVTFADSGKPAAGVTISAWLAIGGTAFGPEATDANGEYRIKQLPAGTFDIRVRPAGELARSWMNATTEGVTVGVKQELRGQDVALVQGAVIAGKVTEKSTGKPLPLVYVVASPGGYGTNTNSTGLYTLLVPAGAYRVGLESPPAGFEKPGTPSRAVTVEHGRTYAADIELTRNPAANSITGRVLDEDDKPVAGAMVMLAPVEGGAVPPRPGLRAGSDANGRFTAPEAQGEYLLRAAARKQEAVTERAVHVVAGENVTVHVKRGAVPTIKGKVTDQAEKGIRSARAYVAIEILPGTDAFTVFASRKDPSQSSTDAEGNYSIPGLFPDARYRVLVEADGYGTEQSAILPPFKAGESRDVAAIVLKPAGGFVAGRVVDVEGRPVKHARVVVVRDVDAPSASTDAGGNFRVERIADAEFELSVQGYTLKTGRMRTKAGTSDNVLIVRPTSQPDPAAGPSTSRPSL